MRTNENGPQTPGQNAPQRGQTSENPNRQKMSKIDTFQFEAVDSKIVDDIQREEEARLNAKTPPAGAKQAGDYQFFTTNSVRRMDTQTAVKVMNIECDLYDLAPSGDYEIAFEWDDSILTDIATELDQRLLLLDRGIEGRLGLRMWYYGETKKQAEDALAEIDQEDEKQEEEPFGEDPPLIYSEAKDT